MTSARSRPRVLVTYRDLPQICLDLLKTKCDITVMNYDEYPPLEDVLKLLPEYDALLGLTPRLAPIDTKFLEKAGNKLKIISSPYVGFDHIDVAEAKRRNIKVATVPQVSSATVAEIAVFLLLGAMRRVREMQLLQLQNRVRYGLFQNMLGYDVKNKIVGIAGLGNVGIEIVKRLQAFQVKKFLYTNRTRKQLGDEIGAEFVSLDDLLTQSDIVIDCVPLTPETENMFNDDTFKKMKSTSVFVNVGRGRTVDTDALVRALKNKTMFAAGLDVTEQEPLPADHELLKLPNAMITPHMGTQTVEARTEMAIAAVQNILNYFDDKLLLNEM